MIYNHECDNINLKFLQYLTTKKILIFLDGIQKELPPKNGTKQYNYTQRGHGWKFIFALN